MSSGSPSKRPQMQEYTIIPIIGTYVPSSDVRTAAVYLSKPNMRIVELKDIEKPGKIEGEVEVYERRVAKAVIPVPLTRGSMCIHSCIYVLMNTCIHTHMHSYIHKIPSIIIPSMIIICSADVESAVMNLMNSLKKSQDSAPTPVNLIDSSGNNVITNRDGGIFDNMRYLLSQGLQIGDNSKRQSLLGSQPTTTSARGASLSSAAIMKEIQRYIERKKFSNPYVGFILTLKELLGLSVQGMMLEVADRPSGGSIYVGGAVLVGIEGAVDENGEPEIPIWSSSTANEIIKKTQNRKKISSLFLKCHSDEVVGLQLALRYLNEAEDARLLEETPQAFRSQYQRILRTLTVPIAISQTIAGSLEMDVVMKKYISTVQLKDVNGEIKVKKRVDSSKSEDIQLSGPITSGKNKKNINEKSIQHSSTNVNANANANASTKADIDSNGSIKYTVGDRVEINGNKRLLGVPWFPGEIIKVNDDYTYDIKYTDGVVEKNLQAKFLRPIGETAASKSVGVTKKRLTTGQMVEARYQGGSKYYSGKIVGVNNDDTYNIEYTDGDREEKVPRGMIQAVGGSSFGTSNPDLMNASIFLSMTITQRRDWLRSQVKLGSAMPRPREGPLAVNAACYNFMDIEVVYEVLRRLGECSGDEKEAAMMIEFESKKPATAKAILVAQSAGDDEEKVQELNALLQKMGYLDYDPFRPYMPDVMFDIENWYYEESRSRTGQRKIG